MYYLINPETLRTLRDRKGWTQEKLAIEAGIDRQTILRKEQQGAARTREFVVDKLASALEVSKNDLTLELPDSKFESHPQIFIDLEDAIGAKDHVLSTQIIDYIIYKLACALYKSEIYLAPNWIEQSRISPKPPPEKLPRWPSYYVVPENDEKLFGDFLREWHEAFGDRPISPSHLLSSNAPRLVGKSVRALPVMENGKASLFRLRAYLRRKDRSVANDLQLWRFPNLTREAWVVVPRDTQSERAGEPISK